MLPDSSADIPNRKALPSADLALLRRASVSRLLDRSLECTPAPAEGVFQPPLAEIAKYVRRLGSEVADLIRSLAFLSMGGRMEIGERFSRLAGGAFVKRMKVPHPTPVQCRGEVLAPANTPGPRASVEQKFCDRLSTRMVRSRNSFWSTAYFESGPLRSFLPTGRCSASAP